MNAPYSVMVVGMGKRGMHHAAAFRAHPRFRLAGICDIDQQRLTVAAAKLGNPEYGADAAALARKLKPEVFCFCTLPHLRSAMIRIGVEAGARLIAFEKPIAMSSREALQIKSLLEARGVKAVVSHQHRYGEHYRKTRELIVAGKLGAIHTVYGTATGWMLHMATHLIDYMRWFNGNADAEWVMAQAAGRRKLDDAHASPDYLGGFIHFRNGVRGILEVGAGAPDVPEVDYWWRKCRIGAQGPNGFAETLTGGGWRAVTAEGAWSGPGCMNYDLDMPPYIQDIADWLDHGRVHPCNFAEAFKGFEILMALCRSVVAGGQVALPLAEPADEIEDVRRHLPDRKVMLAFPENAKEYA